MNILHLVSYAVFSGPLPPTLQLAEAQRALGHRVWLAYDTLRGPFSPYEEAASPRVSADWLPPKPPGLSPKAGPLQWWRDRRRIGALAAELQLDVLHTHLSHDQGLVAFAGLHNTVQIHTLHSRRPLGRSWHRRILWRATHGVIARSAADQRRLEGLKLRHKPQVKCIPGALDASAWPRAQAEAAAAWRQHLKLPAHRPVLLHVALMTGRGQRELLAAWELAFAASLAEAPLLVFVGAGPEQSALEDAARSSAVHALVRFAGYLGAEALAAAYSTAQGAFVAQPGNDASARAALEAMHYGVSLLVIAAEPDDALGSLGGEGRALVATTREPKALAAMLARWWGSMRKGRSTAAAARQWLSQARHPEQEATQTIAFYQQVQQEACQPGSRRAKASGVGA